MMTTPIDDPPPRRIGRSILAILAGFLTVVVLSLGIDEILHLLHVYPPWGVAMHEPGLNALALAYRCAITVLGGYVTARLAPRNPMRHVVILGLIGLAVATLGAVATIPMNIGPAWYPIALVVTALPLTWLGGVLYKRRAAAGA
jgi:hypothetical protein